MKLLRDLILEYVIDVTEKDDDGNVISTKRHVLDDDEYDDYKFYMSKLKHTKWPQRNLMKKRKKQDASAASRGTNIDQVVRGCTDDAQKQDRLKELIDAWHEDMYLVLLYMSNSSKPGTNEFPFFQTKLELNREYPFPVSPSRKSVNYAYNTVSRAGIKETGKGEMLIALMTGGEPVISGKLGDIDLDGELWEVKDLSKSRSARLGGPISANIVDRLLESGKIKSVNELKSRTELQGTDPQLIADITDEIIKSLEGLAGFVVIEKDKILTRPIDSVTFEYYSKSQNRVHVKFKS